MRRINLILLLILLLSILSACTVQSNNTDTITPTPTSSSNDEAKESISEYFPLSVGNTWVYEGYGNEFAGYTQKVVYNKNNKYQTTSDNGGTIVTNVIQVEKDRLVNIYREGETYEDKNMLEKPENINLILLKLPIEIGNSWVSEENKYEIIKTNETIVVPYGELENCIVIKTTYKDGNENLTYYKKGIGVVQSDFVISENEVISSKLKEAILK